MNEAVTPQLTWNVTVDLSAATALFSLLDDLLGVAAGEEVGTL